MLERRLNRYPSKHLTIVCREVPLALRYWALTLISGYGEIRQTKSRDRSGQCEQPHSMLPPSACL